MGSEVHLFVPQVELSSNPLFVKFNRSHGHIQYLGALLGRMAFFDQVGYAKLCGRQPRVFRG